MADESAQTFQSLDELQIVRTEKIMDEISLFSFAI